MYVFQKKTAAFKQLLHVAFQYLSKLLYKHTHDPIGSTKVDWALYGKWSNNFIFHIDNKSKILSVYKEHVLPL